MKQNEKKTNKRLHEKKVLLLLVFYAVVYTKNAFYSNGTKATPYTTSTIPSVQSVMATRVQHKMATIEQKILTQSRFCIRQGIIFHVVLFVKDLATQKEVHDGIKRFLPRAKLERKKMEE